MNSNKALIEKFYSSFERLDHEGMGACYHEEVTFTDPVFPSLKGKQARAMWKMLIDALSKNRGEWKLEFTDVVADEEKGSCRWDAHYTFSLTGRKVHNIITANFLFKDEKIIKHDDIFDFYRWARMAFGPVGFFLGWTQFFKRKLQRKTSERLTSFIKRS